MTPEHSRRCPLLFSFPLVHRFVSVLFVIWPVSPSTCSSSRASYSSESDLPGEPITWNELVEVATAIPGTRHFSMILAAARRTFVWRIYPLEAGLVQRGSGHVILKHLVRQRGSLSTRCLDRPRGHLDDPWQVWAKLPVRDILLVKGYPSMASRGCARVHRVPGGIQAQGMRRRPM